MQITQAILNPLWLAHLKVSYSIRTISETIDFAQKEISFFHALLDGRFVYGNQRLADELLSLFDRYCKQLNKSEYIQERLDSQKKRRQQFGNTVFLQEPDIKNGVGGLRDYQNICWMGRVCLNAETLGKLCKTKYLRRSEYSQLKAGHAFLLKVRKELHLENGYLGDILHLTKQPAIAKRLGFCQENFFDRTEAFLREYYFHARNIYQASYWFEQRLQHSTKSKHHSFLLKLKSISKKNINGFFIVDGQIYAKNKNVFKKDPSRLISVFKLIKPNHASISFELSQLIQSNLEAIGSTLACSKKSYAIFLELLADSFNVYASLYEMHTLGILGKLIPEFGALTCLVQHEAFHRYTADIHTLKAIKELDHIWKSQTVYRDALSTLKQPEFLYLTLLLHDIGKAQGIANHAHNGTVMARPILERFGISSVDQEDILFTVENHLEMVRFWQRYDIEDRIVIKKFGTFVETPVRLSLLYIHTYCDAKGTAPGLWNEHKDALHTLLYRNTKKYLENPSAERTNAGKETLINVLKKQNFLPCNSEELETHCQSLPDRYFLRNSSSVIKEHLMMIQRLYNTQEEVISKWEHNKNKSFYTITIAAKDAPGLFYRLASALSGLGLNILTTRAWTRVDGIVIDIFQAEHKQSSSDVTKDLKKQFHKELLKSSHEIETINNTTFGPINSFNEKKRKVYQSSIKRHIWLDNEPGHPYLLLEVHTVDEPKILARLAKCIYDKGFNILFARITTEDGIVRDTFHLGLGPDTSKQESLASELRSIIKS